MKNIKVLALFMVMIMLSGCIKTSTNITVNSDGSLDYGYVVGISKSAMEMMKNYSDEDDSSSEGSSTLTEEEQKALKEKGYTVEELPADDSFKGFKVTKHYNSIDDVSTTDDVVGSTDITKDDLKTFTVKKGFLKNTYKAKIEYSSEKESYDSVKTYNTDEYKEYFKDMDISFNITLPSKAKSSNATSVDKNTYTWNLVEFDKEYIEIEFEVLNTKNVIICVAIAVAAVLCVCAVVYFIKKKKTN